MNIAVFASHNGSDLQAIIDGCKNKKIKANVSVVISNNENSIALKRAEQENIQNYHLSLSSLGNEDIFASKILEVLKLYEIDIIFLAGYMKLLPSSILEVYKNRVFNIHPNLLPKYGGKGMYGIKVHKAVIDAKEKETGITIHRVNSEYDSGDIIAQTKINVLDTDTPESLANRVLEREHEFLVEIISKIAEGKITLGKTKSESFKILKK